MMTKIITLIMLMSLGLCAFGQEEEITDKNLELQALLIDGNKFFILEQYDKAAEKFQDLILMDQTNSAAYYGLSRVSSAKKNYTQAVRQIREALEYEPENTYYLDHLVTNLRYLKDDKALVEAYKRLISLEPEEKKHLYELSKCYERMKDYKSAIDVLEEMEEGSNPAVAYRMADIYTKMGKEKKALTIYEDMVSAHPGQTRYMHMLANHYREIGENDEALEVYKKILDLDPEDSRAGLAIANSQRNTGSDVLYLQSIKKIITGESINAEIKVRELIPFVQKMSVNPNDALLDKLQEYADILIELHPEEAAVYALAADLYHIKDNSKAALEHYGKSLERRKDVYTVWEQFLLLTSEKKDWEALRERSNEALDFFPNRPKVNMMHGLALYKTGNPAAARSVLMQARMMSANNAILIFEINALLGEVLYELGDY
ncbi:MAG: tetratricopeptide repeat protein, partial [Saprospiraceae bacterium]|nr:tetratricopeptide repeat protein [Saprospiraceae bacterium]